MSIHVGKPLRGEAADRIMERIQARVQPFPKRCTAQLFDGPEWRCHRDAGHRDAHVHYAETSGGLSGWHNEEG